MNEDKMNEMKV